MYHHPLIVELSLSGLTSIEFSHSLTRAKDRQTDWNIVVSSLIAYFALAFGIGWHRGHHNLSSSEGVYSAVNPWYLTC